jgi:membrane-associated protease RseP (regulator of RpoE activity)
MFEISDPYFVSVVMFFALLGIIIYRDRKNVEFHTVVIMRRTERFRGFIEWVANLSPRFWRAASTLGIGLAVLLGSYMIYILLVTTRSIILGLIKQPALMLVLPSPSATGAMGPGYFLIPFWFWIIMIGAILVPHEMMHGVVARAEKIRLRSVGLLLLVIFPGAFVEPDEKQLQKARLLTRLRVFAAGSFANFSLAALIVGLLAFAVWPAFSGTGLVLDNVTAGSPAALAGMHSDQLLTSVNGVTITSTYWEYAAGRGYLADEVGALQVGQNLTFVADGTDYVVQAANNTETGAPYVGINYFPEMNFVSYKTFIMVVSLLSMIAQFSLAVGMVNILPIYPLDGGLMFEAVLKRYVKKVRRVQTILSVVTYFLIIVLLFDFIGPWLLGMF